MPGHFTIPNYITNIFQPCKAYNQSVLSNFKIIICSEELSTSFIEKLTGVCGEFYGCKNPVPGARTQGLLDFPYFSSSTENIFIQTDDSVPRRNPIYLLLLLILFNCYLNTLEKKK